MGQAVKSPEQEGCPPSVSQREGFFADNPAFRRMMNQLKLSEPVSNSGTGSEEE